MKDSLVMKHVSEIDWRVSKVFLAKETKIDVTLW